MNIKPRRYGIYKAKVNYQKTTDIKQPSPENGEIIKVRATSPPDPPHEYENDMIMYPIDDKYPYWIPERDLILLEIIELP